MTERSDDPLRELRSEQRNVLIEEWRTKAAELRAIAETTADAATCQDMLDAAANYERLADEEEGREEHAP